MNPSARSCVELDVTIFLLLHGNWHAGSAWDGVSRRLEQFGHIAHAPTLPGQGQQGATGAGYQEAGEAVADYIVDRDLRDIVMVGHSGGGVAISKAVELIPDRVEHLVYLSGWVLKDGESILKMVPAHYRELFASMAAESPNNTVEVPFERWRSSFINDADGAAAKSAFTQLVPEPFSYLVEPVNFTTFYNLTIPKSYILPTEDIVLPRDDKWGWHPRMTSRLGEHRFLEMPGSHEVMFTNPRGLADTIIEACID
jgi:pimeloyl-ACP methyl ester carboxylesterase